ncbi:MAG: DUF1631 domain-containing protein [Gammaproteobacteria bacterium]|nr:DUF1631 domain-containing protein [Gammaproteobacteria bacterium]
MSNPKVVSLQTERQGASAIPPIVNSLRQQARRQLMVLVRELLDCTDDALFEMADRSQSNTDHHLYFDSMRQIRLNRSEIEKQFAEHLNQGFQRVFGNASQTSADSIDEVDADNVALVHNDDLEISVAISGITSKITSKFSLPIMELTKRFDHLAKHATVNERRNPLGPQAVSEAFGHAIEAIDVDIKIRIILLKLFERMVMQRMGPIYEEANRALADAGVLKDLRRSLGRGRNPSTATPRPPAGDGRGGSAAAGGGGYGAAGGSYAGASDGITGSGGGSGGGTGMDAGPGSVAGFNAIQSLLAGMRGPEDGQAPPAGGMIATPQLMSLLNRVQTEASQQSVSVAELPPTLDLREVVVSRAPDVTGEAMNHLDRADEDVVNFIGMLFDYILNDRNLAIPMKALIARLQIPIVKLAILDKSFFDKSAHPARQLLNELSSAGIGWSSAAELKRDAVYDKIESVVIRVLNGFSDNPDIFSELLEELREFRTRDTVRNERIEARVKEHETGRARTLAAKQEVQQVINQKACGLRLPHELGRFLSDVWSRVLLYVSLREGTGSASWESLMLTLDDALWSLQPLDDLDQIERRDDMRDPLLDRLAAGMNLIQISETEQDNWCDLIRRQLESVSDNDRSYLEDDHVPRLDEQYEEMAEIVLAAPHEVSDNYAGEAPAPDFVEKINRLSEGSWVEITQDDDQVLRCKLATIVKPGDRYVFVNRRGMKVAEKSRMELARELQDDRLVMLNDSQVFDRALQAVIGNLRQIQSQGV